MHQSRILLLIGALVLQLVLFGPTALSLIAIWWRSETFAHGFLVIPIVLLLVWGKRRRLRSTSYDCDWRALPVLAGVGFFWLTGSLTDVLVFEQLAFVAMIPVLVWLFLGFATLRTLAFPLGFLFFAVPVGEELVYPLMQFTAMFTVAMVQLSGIPVYWEGTFISLPTGDWSVVAACSGVRYLIASVFLGVLFAYLNYNALWRRLAFVALSFVVPILANGFRAYFIVMLGHLSDMRIATGVDHLIYGWLFFGLVMFLLFAIGSRWSDRPREQGLSGLWPRSSLSATTHPKERPLSFPFKTRDSLIIATGLALIVFWPVLNHMLALHSLTVAQLKTFALPSAPPGYQETTNTIADWSPRYKQFSLLKQAHYETADSRIGLLVLLYGQGAGELVNSENVLVPEKDSVWRLINKRGARIDLGDRAVALSANILSTSATELLVWQWFWVNGHQTANPLIAKLYEAKALLTGQRLNQAAIFLYTPLGIEPDLAHERLGRFLEAMIPSVTENLQRIARSNTD